MYTYRANVQKMKFIYTFLLFLLSANCKTQTKFTFENFEEEFFNYQPSQKETVSDKDFEWAVFVLDETQKALNKDDANYHVTHYWNILSAFDKLEEDVEILQIVFKKMAASEGSCTYITSYKDKVSFDDKIPLLYERYFNQCQSNSSGKNEFDLDEYIGKNMLDSQLVHLMIKIDLDDQKYRSASEEIFNQNQPALDLKNQGLIDSLFGHYKTYIGTSLVGEKYAFVMWSVIQHSNLKMMEKYLPIVYDAVKKEQLELTPLKMLIDRYFGLKYGYQVFGTQHGFGFEMADEKTRKEISKKYGL